MVDLSLIGKVLRVRVLGWRKFLIFISRFDMPVAERIGEAKGTMSLRVES